MHLSLHTPLSSLLPINKPSPVFSKMVNLDCKKKVVSSQPSPKSRKHSEKPRIIVPSPSPVTSASASPSSSLAYEQYIRLPELSSLWTGKSFPNWKNESLIKPGLQALEITFRFISIVLSDPRPYTNHTEWTRRLESLTTHQLQLIASLCEDDSRDDGTRGTAPTVDLSSSTGVLTRQSSSEVWNVPGASQSHVVSKISDASLLPRLATWRKSEDIATKISFSIECEMRRCPYTLGLGEPNLSGKPELEYDIICKPAELHTLKKITGFNHINNRENQILFTIHQILETWIHLSRQLIERIENRINSREFVRAASDCWLLERIWKLLSEIEDLHLLTDPDDFLRLKNQLSIKSSEAEPFCFRSRGLIEVSSLTNNLQHKVSWILNEEADPMKLYRSHREEDIGKVELLQAFQGVESGMKRFYFAYRQVIGVVMGSLEASGKNRDLVSGDMNGVLYRVYSEPTWFKSLDGAKTRLGEFWRYENGKLKCNGSVDSKVERRKC